MQLLAFKLYHTGNYWKQIMRVEADLKADVAAVHKTVLNTFIAILKHK